MLLEKALVSEHTATWVHWKGVQSHIGMSLEWEYVQKALEAIVNSEQWKVSVLPLASEHRVH
jgi:hypothetical protein